MASCTAVIPPSISALDVFDTVSREIVASMEGISVAAYGDERIGNFFSVTEDRIFKTCTDAREIYQKVCDGSAIGTLSLRGDGWSASLDCPWHTVVDDCTIPKQEHYAVSIALINHPGFGSEDVVANEYAKRLGLLEEPGDYVRKTSESWGDTRDVCLNYRIRFSRVPEFLRHLGLPDDDRIQTNGEIQELEKIAPFFVDFVRYGFRGLYAVYSEPVRRVTNYPLEARARFCALVDAPDSGVLASVGRRHCAFRCKDGRVTRTLAGNRFDIHQSKTKRSLTIDFERYEDTDPPVKMFSGAVREHLAALGMKI